MRKINFIIVILTTLCIVSSCSNKKAKKSRNMQIEEFRSTLTASDSTNMLNLCNNAMELLKANKIEDVVSKLYLYNDSTKEVKPLSEEIAKRYTSKFKMFPVLDYKLQYYSFMLEGCNDVRYEVVFAKSEDAGTDKDPVTAYMFNPVKIDGEWKLCVKSLSDEIDITK